MTTLTACLLALLSRQQRASQNCTRSSLDCADSCAVRTGSYLAETLRQCRLCRCRKCEACVAAWQDGFVPWAPLPATHGEFKGATQHVAGFRTPPLRRTAKRFKRKGAAATSRASSAATWREVEGLRERRGDGDRSKLPLRGPSWRDFYNATFTGKREAWPAARKRGHMHDAVVHNWTRAPARMGGDEDVRARVSAWEASRSSAGLHEAQWRDFGENARWVLLVALGVVLILVAGAMCRPPRDDYDVEWDGIGGSRITDSGRYSGVPTRQDL